MKLELKKKQLKTLSNDSKVLPAEMTKEVAGGKDLLTTQLCVTWGLGCTSPINCAPES